MSQDVVKLWQQYHPEFESQNKYGEFHEFLLAKLGSTINSLRILTEAYDTKTVVHDRLNDDYIAIREECKELEKSNQTLRKLFKVSDQIEQLKESILSEKV